MNTITVPFHGDALYVVNHNGEPYTPMKPIVKGMGMDWMGHGLNTITGIINRWAPTNENNTQAYIDSVAKSTGVAPDQHVNTADSRFMMKLLQAIIRHENGVQPYSFDVFVRAVGLAADSRGI